MTLSNLPLVNFWSRQRSKSLARMSQRAVSETRADVRHTHNGKILVFSFFTVIFFLSLSLLMLSFALTHTRSPAHTRSPSSRLPRGLKLQHPETLFPRHVGQTADLLMPP